MWSQLKDGGGLLWWLSDKESICQCRRRGFDPWFRKILHAEEQLSPCATTTEPKSHNYWACVLQRLKPACPVPVLTREATTTRNPWTATKSSPHSPQLEKSPCSNKDPAQPKIVLKIKSIKTVGSSQVWVLARCRGCTVCPCWQYNEAASLRLGEALRLLFLWGSVLMENEWHMQRAPPLHLLTPLYLGFLLLTFTPVNLKQRLEKGLGSREVFGRRFSEPSVRDWGEWERKERKANLMMYYGSCCWHQAGPRRAPGHKSLSVVSVSCLEEIGSFSLHDLPWVPEDRFKWLLIREGGDAEKREEESRNNSAIILQLKKKIDLHI